MSQLLAIEWLKIRRYRTFWIICAAFALLFPVVNYYAGSGMFGPAGSMILGDASSFSSVWLNTCFYASHFVIFLALLMALLVTNEVQFRTSRQNVIDGWSRVQSLHAKWALAVVLTLITTLLALVVGLLQGLSQGAPFGSVTDGLQNVGWLFLLTLNYLTFGLTVGLLLRRSGLAIILILVYYMIGENILHALVYYKWQVPAGDLALPLETSDQLLPRPALNAMVKNVIKITPLPAWCYALGTIGWIAIYYAVGHFRTTKKDL